jgi:hypothetical protein
MAAEKSPSTGSIDPTPRSAAVVAKHLNIIFTFVFKRQIHRQARSGPGQTSTTDP